ncbi:MAG: histidine phosphatase family protein [Paracoccaceae bacterium]|nr:histidine phosphatase family protein [Paracoccaceae bacterium]
MTVQAIYLSHPEVEIDPDVPVPRWGLSELGAARTAALAARLGDLSGWRVVSSDEQKAIETGTPLAKLTHAPLIIRPDMHENDRSATGYQPREAFEALADAFFAAPDVSVQGWETARAAQTRIVSEVRTVIGQYPGTPLIFTGHGGVGTLLFCHLAVHEISRQWDQNGGGHWFRFSTEMDSVERGWSAMETLCK